MSPRLFQSQIEFRKFQIEIILIFSHTLKWIKCLWFTILGVKAQSDLQKLLSLIPFWFRIFLNDYLERDKHFNFTNFVCVGNTTNLKDGFQMLQYCVCLFFYYCIFIYIIFKDYDFLITYNRYLVWFLLLLLGNFSLSFSMKMQVW